LDADSVVKNYFTTASDGKSYNVTFYSLKRKHYDALLADNEDIEELKAIEEQIKDTNKKKSN
jgi:molybdate-binding protein